MADLTEGMINMADKATKGAKAEADAPKRKMLTIEERIAKAEAEAKALRAKQAEKDKATRQSLVDDVAKLDARIKELTSKRDAKQAEVDAIDGRSEAAPAEDTSEPELKVV